MTLLTDLEQATEGSRELSDRVYKYWRENTPPPAMGVIWTTDLEYAPNYTTNLQDALLLVPDWGLGKWRWMVSHPGYDNGKHVASHRAEIHHPASSGGGPKWIAFADCPALALSIACLRAMEKAA